MAERIGEVCPSIKAMSGIADFPSKNLRLGANIALELFPDRLNPAKFHVAIFIDCKILFSPHL